MRSGGHRRRVRSSSECGLERTCRLQLFDREQYRATLTDAGRLFHERAASVIESSEALKTFGKQLAGKIEPIVRLAVEAVTPLAPVMQILRGAQERYPTVRIELTTERLSGAADALREGRADLAAATKLGIDTAKLELAHFRTVRIVRSFARTRRSCWPTARRQRTRRR